MTQSSVPQPHVGHSPQFYSLWLIRVALAALILFASQVLFWMEPERQSLLNWPFMAAGSLALSAVLLDFALRWRLYNLFGLLLVAGICGLSSALLLSPQITLADVPRTLVTRVLGLEALAGMAVVAVAGALAVNAWKRVSAAAVAAGLVWELWAHWSPLSAEATEVSLPTVLTYGGFLLALVVVLTLIAFRQAAQVTPGDLRLSRGGWLVILVVGVVLLLFHLAQNQIDVISLVAIPTLVAFCTVMLRFQRRAKGVMLLDSCLPLPSLKSLGIVLPAALFLAAGAIGYFLPRGSDPNNAIALIGAAFTAYGLVWLPMTSLVLGARAFIHEIQTMRL